MTPRIAKILMVILLAPLFVGLIARFDSSFDQVLRTYAGTYSGRIIITYSTILFCFMAGSLWGFSANSSENKATPYILSILPAFYMFSAYSLGGGYRIYILLAGFLLLLPLDYYFKQKQLSPQWWFRFKVVITLYVSFALIFFQFGNYILATLAII
jgi:hypothetical protein